MERATKAVKAVGFKHARIIMDLEQRRIEIIIGEGDELETTPGDWRKDQPLYQGKDSRFEPNPWDGE